MASKQHFSTLKTLKTLKILKQQPELPQNYQLPTKQKSLFCPTHHPSLSSFLKKIKDKKNRIRSASLRSLTSLRSMYFSPTATKNSKKENLATRGEIHSASLNWIKNKTDKRIEFVCQIWHPTRQYRVPTNSKVFFLQEQQRREQERLTRPPIPAPTNLKPQKTKSLLSAKLESVNAIAIGYSLSTTTKLSQAVYTSPELPRAPRNAFYGQN